MSCMNCSCVKNCRKKVWWVHFDDCFGENIPQKEQFHWLINICPWWVLHSTWLPPQCSPGGGRADSKCFAAVKPLCKIFFLFWSAFWRPWHPFWGWGGGFDTFCLIKVCNYLLPSWSEGLCFPQQNISLLTVYASCEFSHLPHLITSKEKCSSLQCTSKLPTVTPVGRCSERSHRNTAWCWHQNSLAVAPTTE